MTNMVTLINSKVYLYTDGDKRLLIDISNKELL